ncbi:hypothetical protein B0T13DRAFT_225519 [Neurospora crassa]|nr:hypothetical protein B0T13DRAFT_225519 [Neurospora crassa]
MANTIYHGAISGESFVVGPQFSHGGTMNIHFANRPGPVTAISKPYSDIPHPSGPDYIDRPIITDWLQQKLNKSPSRAALVGLGGIGKSKLAIRYAEQLCKESPDTYIFWVNSATKDTFVQGFYRISDKLGLPNAHGVSTDMLWQVFNWLRDGENGQWVMILDNADDYFVFRDERTNSDVPPAIDSGVLDSFLPQTGNGRILITSRSQDTARILALGLDNIMVVREMEEDQARLLFSRKLCDLGESDEISQRVVLALNCIPLCISQAAAYIQKLQPRMTCAKYLEKFNGRNFVFLSSRDSEGRYNPDSKNKGVEIKTWQITFNHIRDERQSAAGLLSLMSFFQPQGIPEWVLQKHYSEMVNENSSTDIGHNGEDEFENDMILLRDYSLVTVAEDAKSFQMHSLVQSFTRSWLEASHEDHKWRRCFQQLMIKSFPEDWLENWSVCGEPTPHIEPLVNTTACQLKDGGETTRFVELLRKVGGYNHATAMYETALKIINKAEQLAVQKLGEDHEQVYKIAASNAPILGNIVSVAAAEAAALEAYKGLTRILGLTSPFTITSLGRVALVLVAQEKWAEAEPIIDEAVERHMEVMGPDHPNTLEARSLQARKSVYRNRFKEAEDILCRVLEAKRKVLGPEHPSTISTLMLYRDVLTRQGKREEGGGIGRNHSEMQRRLLDPEHPDHSRHSPHLRE